MADNRRNDLLKTMARFHNTKLIYISMPDAVGKLEIGAVCNLEATPFFCLRAIVIFVHGRPLSGLSSYLPSILRHCISLFSSTPVKNKSRMNGAKNND